MLATLNQSATDLGILKRQHALGPMNMTRSVRPDSMSEAVTICLWTDLQRRDGGIPLDLSPPLSLKHR